MLQGVIDKSAYNRSLTLAKKLAYYIDRKKYSVAGTLDIHMFMVLAEEWGSEQNFNNLNQHSPYPALEALSRDINRYVKPTLSIVNQHLQWNYISDKAFESLKDNFLVPTTKFCKFYGFLNMLLLMVWTGHHKT